MLGGSLCQPETTVDRLVVPPSRSSPWLIHSLSLFTINLSSPLLLSSLVFLLRYLSLTKALYKELVTVYKDAATQEVRISGKAFEVQAVNGLELFSQKANPTYSHLHVIVDPMKKQIVVMKNSFNSFW